MFIFVLLFYSPVHSALHVVAVLRAGEVQGEKPALPKAAQVHGDHPERGGQDPGAP